MMFFDNRQRLDNHGGLMRQIPFIAIADFVAVRSLETGGVSILFH